MGGHLLLLLLCLLLFFRGREVGVAVGKADAACIDLRLVGVAILQSPQLLFADCLLLIFINFLFSIVAGFCISSSFVAFVLLLLPRVFLDLALFGELGLPLFGFHDVLLGVS